MTPSPSPLVKPLRPLAEKTLGGRPRKRMVIGVVIATGLLIILILGLSFLYRSVVRPPDLTETIREVVPELDREALKKAVERARRTPELPPRSPAPSPASPAPGSPAGGSLQLL